MTMEDWKPDSGWRERKKAEDLGIRIFLMKKWQQGGRLGDV